jgi:uncharacterized HAD superfamily protein
MTEWRTAAFDLYKSNSPNLFAKCVTWSRLSLAPPEEVGRPVSQWGPIGWFRETASLRPIEVITQSWLKARGFSYERLTIERGNENVSDPQAHFRNRFHVARRDKIRFFVEDDIEKASKLAFLCDVVFLIDHPYNRPANHPGVTLPNNIIRCSSWDEIHRHIRRLS